MSSSNGKTNIKRLQETADSALSAGKALRAFADVVTDTATAIRYRRGDGSGDAMGGNVHGMGWGDGFGDGRAEYGTGFGQCLGASNDLGDGNG